MLNAAGQEISAEEHIQELRNIGAGFREAFKVIDQLRDLADVHLQGLFEALKAKGIE